MWAAMPSLRTSLHPRLLLYWGRDLLEQCQVVVPGPPFPCSLSSYELLEHPSVVIEEVYPHAGCGIYFVNVCDIGAGIGMDGDEGSRDGDDGGGGDGRGWGW